MLKIIILFGISLLSANTLNLKRYIVMAPSAYQVSSNDISNYNVGYFEKNKMQNLQNAGNNDVAIMGVDSYIKDISITTTQLNTSNA